MSAVVYSVGGSPWMPRGATVVQAEAPRLNPDGYTGREDAAANSNYVLKHHVFCSLRTFPFFVYFFPFRQYVWLYSTYEYIALARIFHGQKTDGSPVVFNMTCYLNLAVVAEVVKNGLTGSLLVVRGVFFNVGPRKNRPEQEQLFFIASIEDSVQECVGLIVE